MCDFQSVQGKVHGGADALARPAQVLGSKRDLPLDGAGDNLTFGILQQRAHTLCELCQTQRRSVLPIKLHASFEVSTVASRNEAVDASKQCALATAAATGHQHQLA